MLLNYALKTKLLINPMGFLVVGNDAEVLPHAIMRLLFGSTALGIATDLIEHHGPDSFIGNLVSTMQGSSDTTFYVITLYFGAVGIRKYPLYCVQCSVCRFNYFNSKKILI